MCKDFHTKTYFIRGRRNVQTFSKEKTIAKTVVFIEPLVFKYLLTTVRSLHVATSITNLLFHSYFKGLFHISPV